MKLTSLSTGELAKIKQHCLTDLYFLGREVMHKDFVESPHRSMCDFYVKKDKSAFKTFREFARAYAGPHDRMQLVPRNTYKSSIKVIDNVQWVLNWPEIRIETVTSTKLLSEAFIDELIAYFVVRGNAERNPDSGRVEGGRPTLFQQLFIEHCLTETESRAGEFVDPVRAHLPQELIFKEPTVGALSIDSSTSGWHCDILDFDDPVSDQNSETGNQLEKLENRMSMITELMMNYGFRHIVATRYNPSDPYGRISELAGVNELYGDFTVGGLSYMCRPCWWLKGSTTYAQPDYKRWVPNADDLELFFPEGAPYDMLRRKMRSRKTFFSQQLNNPIESSGAQFTEDMIRSCIVDASAVPRHGKIYVVWDLAHTNRKRSDYTVGIVGLHDEQDRWWVTHIIRDRFDYTEMCYQIVKAIGQYAPDTTGIEESINQQFFTTELSRLGKQHHVRTDKIDWIPIGTNVEDAKYERMISVHPLIVRRQLLFSNAIPYLDDLIREYTRLDMRQAKNDIPDAISRMVQRYTDTPSPDALQNRAREQATNGFRELAEAEFNKLVFGDATFQELGYEDAPPTPYDPHDPENMRDPYTGLPSAY